MKKFKFLLAGITALSLSNAVLPLSANTEETTAIVEETTTTIEETTTVEETAEVTAENLTPEVKGNPTDEEEEVTIAAIVAATFPDETLQKAVTVALEDNGVVNPTAADFANIIELPIMSYVTSLAGMETLVNLESFMVSDLMVANLSVLGTLTNLTELAIYDSELTSADIAFVQNLTNLTELSLTNNSIRDVSVFAGMTHLQYLNLNNNYINDVTALAGLTSTELYLNNNSILDVTPLANVADFMAINQTVFYSSDFPTGSFDYLIWSVGAKHPDTKIIPNEISHGGVYDAAEQGIKYTTLTAANTPGYTFGSRAGIAPALPSDEELDTIGDILRPTSRMSNGDVSRDFSGTVLFVFSATETDTETVPTLPNTGLSDMGTIAGVSSLAGSAVLMAVRKKIRK